MANKKQYTNVTFSTEIRWHDLRNILKRKDIKSWNDVIIDYIFENDSLPCENGTFSSYNEARKATDHSLEILKFNNAVAYYHLLVTGIVETWAADENGDYLYNIGFDETKDLLTESQIAELKNDLMI